jgi:predicted signal transduction protein with EAL and GGDEF domain
VASRLLLDRIPQQSFSAGIAVFPHNGTDSETLLAIADRTLYDAKQAGRDRVLLAQEMVPVA